MIWILFDDYLLTRIVHFDYYCLSNKFKIMSTIFIKDTGLGTSSSCVEFYQK